MYRIILLIVCLISNTLQTRAQAQKDSSGNNLERVIVETDDGTLDTMWVEDWIPKWLKPMDSLMYLASMFNITQVSFDTSEIKVEWKKAHHFLGLTATLPDSVDHKIQIMAFDLNMYDRNGKLTSTHPGLGNRLSPSMKKDLINTDKGDRVKFNKFYIQCDGHIFALNRNVVIMIE